MLRSVRTAERRAAAPAPKDQRQARNEGRPSGAPLLFSEPYQFKWTLPAALLAAVLLLEPSLQRREIFKHRLGRHLATAGERLERIGPRLRRARRQHLVQTLPDFLVAVEAAAMQRPLPAGHVAGRLVELELQDPREEVARVRRVPRDMELGARIEVLFRPRDRRRDALILLLQVGPGLVVIGGRNRAVEHAPAPLVDH